MADFPIANGECEFRALHDAVHVRERVSLSRR